MLKQIYNNQSTEDKVILVVHAVQYIHNFLFQLWAATDKYYRVFAVRRRHQRFNHLFCDVSSAKRPMLIRGLYKREIAEVALFLKFRQVLVEDYIELFING